MDNFNMCRCKKDFVIGKQTKFIFEKDNNYKFKSITHEEGVEYFQVGNDYSTVPMTKQTFINHFDYISIIRNKKLNYLLSIKDENY